MHDGSRLRVWSSKVWKYLNFNKYISNTEKGIVLTLKVDTTADYGLEPETQKCGSGIVEIKTSWRSNMESFKWNNKKCTPCGEFWDRSVQTSVEADSLLKASTPEWDLCKTGFEKWLLHSFETGGWPLTHSDPGRGEHCAPLFKGSTVHILLQCRYCCRYICQLIFVN